jgi:ParB family chromosome partitioning protein
MHNTPDRHVARLRAGIEAGRSLSQQEVARDEQAEARPSVRQEIPLDRILQRHHDSRKLVPSHVDNLLESIQTLGLIEPLVVDRTMRLLAGGHRLEALRRLRETNPSAFAAHFPGDHIPIRVMAIDAEANPREAMAIEVAENAQRRNYTPVEVQRIAQRLIKAGYRETVGRPKEGDKSLGPALAVVIGRSLRTVRRHLKPTGADQKLVTHVTITPTLRDRTFVIRLRESLARGIAHFDSLASPPVEVVQALKTADAHLEKHLVTLQETVDETTSQEDAPQSG